MTADDLGVGLSREGARDAGMDATGSGRPTPTHADGDSSVRPIRCPECGETEATGGRFGFEVTFKSTAGGQVLGFDDHGCLVIDWFDGGSPSHFNAPLIECGDCGHQWPTRRPWRSSGGTIASTNGSSASRAGADDGR